MYIQNAYVHAYYCTMYESIGLYLGPSIVLFVHRHDILYIYLYNNYMFVYIKVVSCTVLYLEYNDRITLTILTI